MNNDFNDPDIEASLQSYALRTGRNVDELRAELLNIINKLPLALDSDPVTNFKRGLNLYQQIPWEQIREIKPKLIEENYPRRADWTDMDVFIHIIRERIAEMELKISGKDTLEGSDSIGGKA